MSSRPSEPVVTAAASLTPDAEGVITIVAGQLTKRIVKEGTGLTPSDRSDVTG